MIEQREKRGWGRERRHEWPTNERDPKAIMTTVQWFCGISSWGLEEECCKRAQDFSSTGMFNLPPSATVIQILDQSLFANATILCLPGEEVE